MRKTLWTKNFTLITLATVLGAIGSIAGSFALSFLVYDQTGSTLASALVIAAKILPGFILPPIASVWLDRLPRKPFLVGGDALSALFCALAGVYLKFHDFSYTGYLTFSLAMGCLSACDSLAYESLYHNLMSEEFEEKGYTVSGMIYPDAFIEQRAI